MSFAHVLGQPAAIGTLRRALASGRVHHAYRFEGPDGVGKEMAARALARALVCTAKPPDGHVFGDGCGECSACTRASTLSEGEPAVPLHPDVVFVEQGLYPHDTIGRKSAEKQGISVDQVRRVVLERAAYGPHEGRARVFIVRRAEELTTQAANALLKTLEEPHASTFFILLTSRPRELLDTIRSRTLALRFGPLPDAVVRSVLERHGVSGDAAQPIVDLAAGSASAALELADPDADGDRAAFVAKVLEAISAPDFVAALDLAGSRDAAKAGLESRLAALAAQFARDARASVARDAEGRAAVVAARRYEAVTRAQYELERNAAPALLVESLLSRLRTIGA